MSVLTPMVNMDDNMGLGTPNFFTSAWNPELNEFSLSDSFCSGVEDYATYAPQFHQTQAETSLVDYFSCTHDTRFSNQGNYLSGHQLESTQSNDDLDRILGATAMALPGKAIAASHLDTLFNDTSRSAEMKDVESHGDSGLLDSNLSQMGDWKFKQELDSSPANFDTELGDETGKRTSIRYGQITPADSPPKSLHKAPPKSLKIAEPKNRQDDTASAVKGKKPRKSKKRPLTREQEEAKRTKFLERNRVAADKCRQNRKKWIDDLQAKAHKFSADNATKKAQVEELEQEVVQLKSLLFIHSRGCNEKDIVGWVDQESNRVHIRSRMSSKASADDALSEFSQGFEDSSPDISRPPSTHGFASASESASRRHSTATAGDDFSTIISGEWSRQSSRRPSFV